MKIVKLSDLTITPIIESVKQINMSDDEYFSNTYKDYISNSRLKYINPDQEGSPMAYKNGITQESTNSLSNGSAIHQLFLQPESFSLYKNTNKPTAKLGLFADEFKKLRKQGLSIQESLLKASKNVNYYVTTFKSKQQSIIKKCLDYYIKTRNLDDSNILLSDKDIFICESCLNSLKNNKSIIDLTYNKDEFGDIGEYHNEDAIFMDIKVAYKNKTITLPLKMKADNWTIDKENKVIILNDLKTTSSPVPYFMQSYGSFYKYHYARQMAMYSWLLKNYCIKYYNIDDSWKLKVNMLVVETTGDFRSQVFNVNNTLLKQGMLEFNKLIKMVAYYELNGFSPEVKFK